MKSKLKSVFDKSAYWTGVVSIGLVVGLGVQFASAWVAPSQTAPNGNVGAPINTGAIGQFKKGVMRALGLQTPNLRVEPAAGVDPTGRVLAAVNASGDVAYAAGGSGNANVQCVFTGMNIACINVETGRMCTVVDNSRWSCTELSNPNF